VISLAEVTRGVQDLSWTSQRGADQEGGPQPRRVWIAFQAKVSRSETFAWKGGTWGWKERGRTTLKGLNMKPQCHIVPLLG